MTPTIPPVDMIVAVITVEVTALQAAAIVVAVAAEVAVVVAAAEEAVATEDTLFFCKY